MTITPTSLIDLRDKLSAISTRCGLREHEGWKAFQPDENWDYQTRHDGRECPVCMENEGNVSGDTIPWVFPHWIWRDEAKRVVHPRTHDRPDFPAWIYPRSDDGYGCGCSVFWTNYPDVLTKRLADELSDVSR